MYIRFLLLSLKRSLKNYFLYITMLVSCVTLFYSFRSISSKYYLPFSNLSIDITNLRDNLGLMGYLFTFLSALLVYYITRFIIAQRRKEFGTYILMGMPQYKIGFIFFAESLIIGFFSMLVGILCGAVTSNLITSLVMKLAGEISPFYLAFYSDTILDTFLLFGVIFIVLGLVNTIKIARVNVIQLFRNSNFDRKTKVKLKKSNTFLSLCMFLLPILFAKKMIAMKKSPELKLSSEMWAFIMIPIIVIFLIGLFKISKVLLNCIEKRKKKEKIKFKNLNLIIFNTIISGIHKHKNLIACTAASISISIGSIAIVSATGEIMREFYKENSVYDFYITVEGLVSNMDSVLLSNQKKVLNRLNDTYGVDHYASIEQYNLSEESSNRYKGKSIYAISISDYNAIMEMLGYQRIKLSEQEFAIHRKENNIKEDDNLDTVIVNGKNTYHRNLAKPNEENIGPNQYSIFSDMFIILPDNAVRELSPYLINIIAETRKQIPMKDYQSLSDFVENLYAETISEWKQPGINDQNVGSYVVMNTELNRKTTYIESNSIITLLCIYIAIMLFISTIIITSLHIISDFPEQKNQFSMLKKMGASKKDINRCILTELNLYFNFPFLIATLICFVLAVQFIIGNEMILKFSSYKNVISGALQGYSLILFLYGIYFICIYQLYKSGME